MQLFSKGIGIEFRSEKCDIPVIKKEKCADCETIKDIETDGYKYVGILEHNKRKEREMKESFRREYLRTKLIMGKGLNEKIKIMTMKTQDVSLRRYGTGAFR